MAGIATSLPARCALRRRVRPRCSLVARSTTRSTRVRSTLGQPVPGGHFVGATWSVEHLPDGNVRVQIRGEVDLAAEASLVEQVNALAESEQGAAILLDLAAVEFLDSSGIRALLRIWREQGDRVRLVAVSRPVRRVLDIAGLGPDLGVDSTEATSTELQDTLAFLMLSG